MFMLLKTAFCCCYMPPLFSTAVAAAVLHGFPLINLQCYFSHPLNVNDSCIPVYLTTLRT